MWLTIQKLHEIKSPYISIAYKYLDQLKVLIYQ